MAKTAIEKLQAPQKPKIVFPLPERVAHWGPPGASMVISTPQEVDALVRAVPKGRLATVNSLREAIAARHKATITCPVTTGIFLSIAAKAAAEMEFLGASKVTPWWRVLKSDGTLNDKMPGGVKAQRERLEVEGFKIAAKGKSGFQVEGYEGKIAKL